ncbi:MAG: hypothetical protein ACOY0T_39315 [Myxococcota bacterium]
MTLPSLGRALLGGIVLAFSAPAAAAPKPAPHVVEIHVDGVPAAVTETRTVATEVLLRIAVIPVVLAEDAPAPSYPTPGEPFVRAYFDFRNRAPRLVIVDGRTQRELERRVLPESATLETSIEAVTHVLYMVVEALLEDSPNPASEPREEEAGEQSTAASASAVSEITAPTQAAAEKPAEAAVAEQANQRALGLETGVLFRTLHLGTSRLLPGAGVVLDARFDQLEPQLSFAVSGAVHAPFELSLGSSSARLLPWSLAFAPTLQGKLGSKVVGLVGLSAGVTWFSLTVDAAEGVRAASSTGGAEWAIGAIAGVRLRFSPRVAATLSGALDVGIAPRRFVAEVGGERHVLAELPRLRPFVSLSATYSLFEVAANSKRAGFD